MKREFSSHCRRILVWLVVIVVALPSVQAQLTPYAYKAQKQGVFKHGAVSSAHVLASQAGVMMLRKGGNAVDAAIATQWALAVVYPGAGNIGGGGFMVASLEEEGLLAIDYREKAPAAASRDMYIDPKSGKANLSKSQLGHLAAGVPGTVAGLFASLKYARLPMSVLMEPAITLADRGFVITEAEARGLNSYREKFKQASTKPTALVKQGGWKAGDTLVQKHLAATLQRIQQLGRDGFYKGETARLIVAEMKRGNGLITMDDLAAYEAVERTPVRSKYRGYQIVGMPPPSSGGVLLAQMLHMLEPYRLDTMKLHSPQAVQLMIEAERLAYADRAQHLGDADFYPVPIIGLTDPEYAQMRMQQFFKPGKANNSDDILAGTPPVESEETTHLSVVDKFGNMVAVTTTLNGGYGSCTVVGDAGFLLNNEMDDFSAQPGVPNMYGAIGGEANAIAPGKRMLSSMTPTLVFKDGQPVMTVGTPGGTTIITSLLQSIVNVVDFKTGAPAAVFQPKFHHQWKPDVVYVEKGFPAATVAALKAMGYTITERGSIGRTEMIMRRPDGSWEAVADKRGDDSVAGY